MINLVTGANGFLGAYVVQNLVKRGLTVRCLVRESSDLILLEPFKDQIEIAYGDVLDIPSLEKAFEGVEYVYHSAAVISFDPRKKKKMLKTNIEGTANIVNLCLDFKVKKLCHVSSVAALGNTKDDELITENTKWDADHTTSYGISKYHAELEVYRGIAEGLDAVIVNPGMIFGAGIWQTGSCRLFEQVHQGFLFYTDGFNGAVDVRDVAEAMYQLMQVENCGEKYILTAENINFKSLFFDLAQNLNVKPPKIEAQKWMIRMYCVFEWVKSQITRTEPLVTVETAKYSMSNFKYDNSKIKHLSTFSFRPFEMTLKDTATAYLTYYNTNKKVQILHI